MKNRYKFKDLIVFENDNYVVINKPPFISTLEDRNDDQNILKIAKEYNEALQVCHRIDKETSGVLVLSKNKDAYRSVLMQFENRKVEKTYHAVVDGLQDFKNKICSWPINILKKGLVKIDFENGKQAHTTLNTIKAYRYHSLIEAKPKTGRMHQIRIHLSTLKAPIVCDEQYGGEPFYLSKIKKKFKLQKFTNEETLIKRFALHAYKIEFTDLDNKPLEIIAPYTKDFAVLVKQLDKNT